MLRAGSALIVTIPRSQGQPYPAPEDLAGAESTRTFDFRRETESCIYRHNPVLVWYDSRDGPVA